MKKELTMTKLPTKVTQILLVLTIAVYSIYDVIVYILGGYEATISYQTLQFSIATPIIPFACGILCGHLFWPQYRQDVEKK